MSGSAGGGDVPEGLVRTTAPINPRSSGSHPQKYSRRETSGLSATVGDEDYFEFKLTSK